MYIILCLRYMSVIVSKVFVHDVYVCVTYKRR